MRIKITLAYDGLYFIGSQKQKEGRTIQGDFEKYLSLLFNEQIKVIICSRLDAKVSAKEFVLVFDTNNNSNIPLYNIKTYLQDKFDKYIRIINVEKVKDNFHPRYDCKYKIYSYQIYNSLVYDPIISSHYYIPNTILDGHKLKQALKLFKGTHDFNLFCTNDENKNTIFEIMNTKLVKKKEFIYLKFKGHSFLRYQIRFMVGAIILYAQNKLSLNDIIFALENNKSKNYTKNKIDGNGLILEKIVFKND